MIHFNADDMNFEQRQQAAELNLRILAANADRAEQEARATRAHAEQAELWVLRERSNQGNVPTPAREELVFCGRSEEPTTEEPEPAPLQLREGGIYRSRSGRPFGPMSLNRGGIYCWTDGEWTWTKDGLYRADEEHGFDLIEELSLPMADQPPGDPCDCACGCDDCPVEQPLGFVDPPGTERVEYPHFRQLITPEQYEDLRKQIQAQEAPRITIEAGKEYLTEGGDRVGPLQWWPSEKDDPMPWYCERKNWWFTTDGRWAIEEYDDADVRSNRIVSEAPRLFTAEQVRQVALRSYRRGHSDASGGARFPTQTVYEAIDGFIAEL